ncbi:MAG: hypothetical protein HC830_14465 [Bacteroidetes bacterium]|nr:hypothetical protein [Bacteroidota bacterium]
MNASSETNSEKLPDIPREVFIEDYTIGEGAVVNSLMDGITQVYNFLQADYESKGYSDSLVNPDHSYKTDNIRLIKFDLQILIEKVDTYYENLISELNFHIESRTRAGLVDLVRELENKKTLTLDYRQKIKEIKQSVNDENGMCQRIILSYQRGFMRGLSAITQSNVLNKKL